MPRPVGVSMKVDLILSAEVERLRVKSETEALNEQDLIRLEKLISISKILVAPAAVEEHNYDAEKVVAEFKRDRPPELFPKTGRNRVTKSQDPDKAPPE
jgi:hypothetical protein